jgi:hypothetical protein
VLYGPDAPPDVPAQMDWGFLSLLPDRASQASFKTAQGSRTMAHERPGSPARAMVLTDLPAAYNRASSSAAIQTVRAPRWRGVF